MQFWSRIVLSVAALTPCVLSAQDFPSTEQFHSMLTGCAAGAGIEASADLVGNISSIYDADRTNGHAVIKSQSQFLNSIPDADKLEAYRLYTACIKDIVHAGP